MKISVIAKPQSNKELVEKMDEGNFVVHVKEPPIDGRANRAIVKALADYFGTSTSQVRIVLGHTSRHKIVEIL